MSSKNCDLFRGKIALAPMVRAGRTPLRVLSLNYGADLAYTEEIVDIRLLQCKRIVNNVLGTIDYLLEDEIVLRVAKEEADKCILQIGTNSAKNATEVCKLIGNDVAGIDVNMGCPKPFSVHNGMGAAMLSQPDNVKEILTAMVETSNVPVSCKIRVLDEPEKTLEFVKMVERCGVSAIGVHGRRRGERPSNAVRVDEIRDIARSVSVPVLANGISSKIFTHADILKHQQICEASGVLVARKALAHPSIFCANGVLLSMQAEIENFLDKCCDYNEPFLGTKYVLQRLLGSAQEFDSKGRATVAAANNLEICRVWAKEAKYLECRRQCSEEEIREPFEKRRKFESECVDGINVYPGLTFAPKKLALNAGNGSPKCVLNSFCDETLQLRPQYEVHRRDSDGRYDATVFVSNKRFRSDIAQTNKKMAEQVAALAALIGLNQKNRLSEKYVDE